MKEINTLDFEAAINDNFSFIYITATWCGPCKAFSPIVNEVSESYKDKIPFFKVDADDSSLVLSELGVKALPTIITFRNGVEVERASGLQTKQKLISIIENTISTSDTFSNDEDF